jgi:hypothetical protein
MPDPIWWFPRRAAERAITRCYGVPYLDELTRREHHGMTLLERDGVVVRDEGGLRLHWHRHPDHRDRSAA